jgi:DNA invertase Pin-like site-specific DNA recombinase
LIASNATTSVCKLDRLGRDVIDVVSTVNKLAAAG